MNQQEAAETIANLLEASKASLETALNLGREHGVPVDLNKIGIGGDMWYTDKQEYVDELRRDEIFSAGYTVNNEQYQWPDAIEYGKLTPEQRELIDERVNERLQDYDEGGRDSYGYQHWGWMSSSTNC